MLADQDEYVAEFAADALRTILGILNRFHPGRLIEFVVERDTEVYSMSAKFTIDDTPGLVYSYKRPILDVTHEPELSAESAASILFGSIMERLARTPTPTGNRMVDLNR